MTINVTDTVGANNTIVLDGNSKIPAIDGSQVTALNASAFTTGSLATVRIDVGTTAGKILQLDGSARIPALSGVNLTNAPGPTVSTSDPAIDTNPTLGKKWINKTSGEVYICTDATAGENVWTNVGGGSGDVVPYVFQGSNYGYATGGFNGSAGDYIDKWTLTSDANATAVGDMSVNKGYCGGISSTTYGYNFGGNTNVIDKFSFSTDGNSTDIGDLLAVRVAPIGTHTESWGYSSGGYSTTDNIEKISFTTDGNSVDQGNLTVGRSHAAGASSLTYGYVAGGQSPVSNVIDKHAFANSNNATDVGDLVHGAYHSRSGTSSTTYGYAHNGFPLTVNIERWSFTSDGNSTDVADSTLARFYPNGVTSTTHGYAAGGNSGDGSSSGAPRLNTIDKYPFASNANATDVGDLTQTRQGAGGHQY